MRGDIIQSEKKCGRLQSTKLSAEKLVNMARTDS